MALVWLTLLPVIRILLIACAPFHFVVYSTGNSLLWLCSHAGIPRVVGPARLGLFLSERGARQVSIKAHILVM